MNRSDYIAHLELAEGRMNVPFVAPHVHCTVAAPITRKPIPAYVWLLTLAPWVVVCAELAA
jgi:hypothetical protein